MKLVVVVVVACSHLIVRCRLFFFFSEFITKDKKMLHFFQREQTYIFFVLDFNVRALFKGGGGAFSLRLCKLLDPTVKVFACLLLYNSNYIKITNTL